LCVKNLKNLSMTGVRRKPAEQGLGSLVSHDVPENAANPIFGERIESLGIFCLLRITVSSSNLDICLPVRFGAEISSPEQDKEHDKVLGVFGYFHTDQFAMPAKPPAISLEVG
jgi:hypothetical protein